MSTLAPAAGEARAAPLRLHLEPVVELSDEQLFELCRRNPELRIERTAEGDLVIMTPTGFGAERRVTEILFQLEAWARIDGTGVAFGSSGGFILPNGAMRSPDAGWVRRSRLAGLSREEKERFLPLCPDFVLELRSPTDRLADQQRKLEEYLGNGAVLGLLVDPIEKTVYVFRPGQPVETLRSPHAVAGDPELPGFSLELDEIWNPRW